MNRPAILFAVAAMVGLMSSDLLSQDPEPAAAPAPVVTVPAFVVPTGNVVDQLKAIRDSNARLLDAQAATLLKLEEMEKTSQTLKILGKRS